MKHRIMRRLPLAVWLVNVLAAVLSYFMNMMWMALPLIIAAIAEWGPAVMRIRGHTREGKPLFRKKPPAWVLSAAVVSVIYTFVNFIVCAVQMEKGGLVEGRMFTGHPLVFTGVSMYILWPGTEKSGRDEEEGGKDG